MNNSGAGQRSTQSEAEQARCRMNYYPGGVGTPAGYAVAVADKPGLYTASPYASVPSFATAQPGLPPSMQHYAAVRQQYAMVSQPSPYPSSQHAAAAATAAYYASPTATRYAGPTAVPLSSLQSMSSAATQSPYLSTQYAAGTGVQAMLRPTSVATGGYGGGSLYAMSAYNGLPTMQAQGSRAPYAVGPVGFAAGASVLPSVSNPAYPDDSTFGASLY